MIRSTARSKAAFSAAQVTWPSSSMLQNAWNLGAGGPSGRDQRGSVSGASGSRIPNR
jgi:hypothetical protein